MSRYDQATTVERRTHWATYVTVDGEVIEQERQRMTPNRLKTSCPPGSKFVIRFGPRSKQWEAYDLRKFVLNPSVGEFYAAPPASVTTPDRDVAIFYAVLG
jgi:hypothetical protein